MRRRRILVVAFTLTLLFAVLPSGTVMAADGILDIGAPWGPENQDPSDPLRVEVSYTIKAGGNIPDSAVQAAQNAVNKWNTDINGRETGSWDFELVAFSGAGSTSGSSGPPTEILFSHNDKAPPNHGGGGGGGGGPGGKGGEADIEIQIKKGGGRIAGSAQSSFDDNGFRVHVKIQISASSFGLPNSEAEVFEIVLHEVGHALGLRHHSNNDDLMGTTVGSEFFPAAPSSCDLDGFEASHHWLTEETSPHLNHASNISCLP